MSATPESLCPDCGGPLRRGGLCPRCLLTGALAKSDTFEMETPTQVGDYELIEEIARGGMGVVWRARQRRLKRTVALKLLRESSLPGEAVARRFRIEAEAAAQLRHPHIVSVYEVGEVGGRWFLSMELLKGSLEEHLKGGTMAAREAAEMVGKIARAVQHAHDRGILHRDLKPANVLLDEAGEPRVADFGLAQLSERDSSLTATGSLVGTPAYMSPEQAAGRELTTASDIYGLGAILYELLAGLPPFQAETLLEMVRKVADEEPERMPWVERDLGVIAMKCMEKLPAGRYPSALALAEDLDRWLRGEPIVARRATTRERLWKWARRRPAVAALWALVMLIVLGVAVGSTLYAVRLERERTAALHGLARQHTQGALALMEAGDWHAALLSLVRALEIGTGDAARDRMNRVRFECILREAPRLAALWSSAPRHAQFTADGKGLLFVNAKGARLYDAGTGVPLGPEFAQEDVLIAAEANADGTRVVTGTGDDMWKLWDPRTGKLVAYGEGRPHALPPPGISRPAGIFGGDRFVVVIMELAQCFRADNGLPSGAPIVRRAAIRWAVLTPNGSHVHTVTDSQLLKRDSTGAEYKVPPGAEIMHFSSGAQQIEALQAEGNWFGIIHWPEFVPKVTDVFREPIFAQSFRRKLNWVLLARSPRGISFVDGWQPVMPRLLEHGASGVAGAFDNEGVSALTLASDGSAQQWDLAGDRRLGPRLRLVGPPVGVALSGDGQSALLRSGEMTWLWRQPQPLLLTSLPADAVFPAELSADGGRVVRMSPDATTLICDARSGAVLFAPLRHQAAVDGAGFSPDGKLVVTRAGEAVQIWDAATGQAVTPPIFHPGLYDARWSADSSALFSRGRDGWRAMMLSEEARSIEEMHALASLLAARGRVPGSDQGLIALSAGELQAAWEAVGAKQPK